MSSNPLLARALGESTGDVVPVLANVPRSTQRSRLERLRQRRDPEGIESKNESHRRDISRLIGESETDEQQKRSDSVIPDEAEEIDKSAYTVGKPIDPPKKVVQEPSHPTADKEKYITPASALTAPDATPQATQPLDASQVPMPGASGPQRFSASDLEKAPAAPAAGKTTAEIDPLSVLLGHGRVPRPAPEMQTFQQAGNISTEEAQRMVGVQPMLAEEAKSRAAAALQQGGVPMPEPSAPTDGKRVLEAFRRFVV